MWKKVQEYMREYELLKPGDRVIAAVSGGADSVCLLSVLWEIMNRRPGGLDIQLRAVHVHHGLRGAEADRDEAYVRELCGKLGVPLTVVHRQVAEYAKEHGLSTEEAGRILRYEAFEAEAERWMAERWMAEERGDATGHSAGTVKIAIAHHQDDSAETILYHLLRGSGLKGLSGIRPVQGNRIRPLLCVSRNEILSYLKEKGLCWCEDSTNASGDYTRNRIRNQILPMLAKTVNARAEENILRAGEIFAQADRYLEEQAEKVWREAGRTGQAEIRLDAFCAQPEIIRTYLIRHMLDQVTPGWKDITARHFRQIADLAEGQVGGSSDLPCGMRAVRGYETLRIERKEGQMTARNSEQEIIPLPVPDGPEVQAGGLSLRAFSSATVPEMPETVPEIPETMPEMPETTPESRESLPQITKIQPQIPKNQYTKWFDYDKIKDTLSVRYRQTGDYLTLPGGGRKTVTRYMIDEKIPRELREQIPVLAEGDHILWVVGYRISEYYKITDTTRIILQVNANGGKEHGR